MKWVVPINMKYASQNNNLTVFNPNDQMLLDVLLAVVTKIK